MVWKNSVEGKKMISNFKILAKTFNTTHLILYMVLSILFICFYNTFLFKG